MSAVPVCHCRCLFGGPRWSSSSVLVLVYRLHRCVAWHDDCLSRVRGGWRQRRLDGHKPWCEQGSHRHDLHLRQVSLPEDFPSPFVARTVADRIPLHSIYSVGITPLQALFPVEVLSFEMRAKGMAFSSLAVNVGGLLNQFAWPVALQNITWKTYIIFTVQDAVQAFIIWWFIPETKNRTVSHLLKQIPAPFLSGHIC